MSEQILSSEEVDAILKVTQDSNSLNASFDDNAAPNPEAEKNRNANTLNNLSELMRTEYEKTLSSFLRKKAAVKVIAFTPSTMGTALNDSNEKNLFSIVRLLPNDHHGIVSIDASFLNQVINLLFGGQSNVNDVTLEIPTGKMGVIITEKLCNLALSSFTQACQDYGVVSTELIKTTTLLNLKSNLLMDNNVYSLELGITLEQCEATLKLVIAEEFVRELIFVDAKGEPQHTEKDFWRKAIKTQVVDSLVTVSVTLPDIPIKAQDFMALKEGDTIPISDPTLVYVCLNNLKLFRAKAGQANSKRVAKILSQI